MLSSTSILPQEGAFLARRAGAGAPRKQLRDRATRIGAGSGKGTGLLRGCREDPVELVQEGEQLRHLGS